MGKGRQDHLSSCLRFLQGYDSLVGDTAPRWHSALTMVSEDFHSLYLVSSILGPWLMEVFTKVLRDLRVAGLWTSLLKKAGKDESCLLPYLVQPFKHMDQNSRFT